MKSAWLSWTRMRTFWRLLTSKHRDKNQSAFDEFSPFLASGLAPQMEAPCFAFGNRKMGSQVEALPFARSSRLPPFVKMAAADAAA